MRNIVASVSLVMCLSASASAMDYRSDILSPVFHTIGWEQKNLDAQAKGSVNIRAQLKKLEDENEQLRNSISKMVEGARVITAPAPDSRIQALVEENKRLSVLLSQKTNQKSIVATPSEGVYARKIASLKNENQKLTDQVNELSNRRKSGDSNALKGYKEENALLKEALNQRNNGAGRIVVLQTQIQELKDKNDALEKSKIIQASSNIKQSEIREKNAKINSLNASIRKVQSENTKLEMAVSAANKKALNYSDRAVDARGAYENNMKALEILKERLAKAQENNSRLKNKITTRSETSSKSDEQIVVLQKQNQSLRETIKAQSGSLISSDNASKVAERLLIENTSLKRDIELASKASAMNGQTARDLIARNKKLQNGIVQRDNYIKKLEGLKETVKLLRKENDQYTHGQTKDRVSEMQISDLLEQSNALQDTLDKERENIIAYRTKIHEYQDKISLLENDSKSKVLIKNLQDERESTTSLRLENQELKARIDLLSQQNNSVVFHKETSFIEKHPMNSSALLKNEGKSADVEFLRGKKEIIPTHEGVKQNITEVTYVDTLYPPVNEVRPMLNKDGKHIALNSDIETPSIEDMSHDPVASLFIKPEDLLAQGLNPLSEGE